MTIAKPKRGWLRFSLRTLLVLTLLLGCIFGWIGAQIQQARRHEAVVKEIERLGGMVSWSNAPLSAWEEWLFGVYVINGGFIILDNVDATDSILAQMKGMNCNSLYLRATLVTDDGFAHLHGIANLRGVAVGDTQITDSGLYHLQGMTSLRELLLRNTRITDAGLKYLNGMTRLEALNLKDTEITDSGLEHLSQMNTLEHLELSYTQITDTGLDHLHGLDNLTYLGIESTNVTQQGIDRLKTVIPDCEIRYLPRKTSPDSTPP